MVTHPGRFRLGPERRDGAFTLLELLVVIAVICVVAGLSIATLGGFLKGSTCKHGGRILQGQFFKARQLAASKRMAHYLRVHTTDRLQSTVTIFEDTNLTRQFNPPVGSALTAGEGPDNGQDNVVGEVIQLPKGAFIGAQQTAPNTETTAGVTAIIAQPSSPGGQPAGTQIVDYQFQPDGTCRRIGVADKTFSVAAGTTYATYPGTDADLIVWQQDGSARLLIDVNPMGGKIQKMIFQVAGTPPNPFQ